MPMKFKMKRDPTAGLVPVGIHRFTVENVTENTNNADPGINMRLRFFPNGKRGGAIFEYLSTGESSRWRVDQFLDAVGAPDTEGDAGSDWFVNKSGWARVEHKMNTQQGRLEAKVKTYMTEAAAEIAIAKIMEGGNDSPTAKTQTSSQPAASPGRKASGKKAEVPELSDEDSPF